jgi:hypothetical protein
MALTSFLRRRRPDTPAATDLKIDSMPASRLCATLKADGTQCGAWALRGSDPPVCAGHSVLYVLDPGETVRINRPHERPVEDVAPPRVIPLPETNGHAELARRPGLVQAAEPVVSVSPPAPAAPPHEPAVDLPLYVKVLWRFKWLVLLGLICAVGLSFLSMMRVSFVDGSPAFAYRQDEEWISFARVFVTRPGFQWGASTPEAQIKHSANPQVEAERIDSQRQAEQRLTSLAIIYANLVDTDAVRRYMFESGNVPGRVEAAPIPAIQGESEVLPIISIAGVSRTPALSREITARATQALRQYIFDQQEAAKLPKDARVVMPLIKRAGDTKLMTPRSKTLPIVVFMTVMITVFVLAFLLESLRPRRRMLDGYDPAAPTRA